MHLVKVFFHRRDDAPRSPSLRSLVLTKHLARRNAIKTFHIHFQRLTCTPPPVCTYLRMYEWGGDGIGEGGNRQLVSQAEKLPLNVSLLAFFSLVPKCRSYWRQTIEASSASIMSAPFMYLFLSNCVYRNAFLSFYFWSREE